MQNDVTLGMIATEVERSLAEAASLLGVGTDQAISADAHDRARRAIEQVRGALQVVEVAGVPRVLLEIEQLLGEAGDVDGQTVSDTRLAEIRTKSARGLDAVQAYVHGLAAGVAPEPLDLAAPMGELLAARGSDRLAELELFETNLSRPLPAGAGAPESSKEGTSNTDLLRDLRAQFQKGLLEWLRGDASGLGMMRDVVIDIHAEATERAPWWVARALIDHLDSGTIPGNIHVKRVFAGLDKYLARLCAGNADTAEPLMREMLYFVGQGEPGSALVEEVRDHYQLVTGQPEGNAAPVVRDQESQARVQALQELWEAAVDGDPAGAQAFPTHVAQVSHDLPEALTPLLETVRRAAEARAAADSPHALLALEVATALIVIAEATSMAEDEPGWLERIDAMNSRLQRVLRDGGDAALGRPDLSSALHERGLLKAFGGELAVLFGVAEQLLAEHFGDSDDADAIVAVQRALQQAHGALLVYGDCHAVAAIDYCIAETEHLHDPVQANEGHAKTDLAAVISALSFYVGRFGQHEVSLAEILSKAGAPEHVITPPAVVPEQSQSAGGAMLSDADLPSEGCVPSDELEPSVDLSSDAVEEATGSGAPTGRWSAGAPSPSGTEEDLDVPSDSELLSVFVEEANDVLLQMGVTVERLRADRHDAEALSTLRRGFHTLKGSGRMVDLWRFAEVAYALEKLLDGEFCRDDKAEEEMLRLLDAALKRIRTWVDTLRSDGRVRIEAEELTQWVERVGHGSGVSDAVQDQSATQTADETTSVIIGDVRLSRTLFEVFVGEAGCATQALISELEDIDSVVDEAKTHERFRLAHTLCGIAGTAGFSALRELAGALELVLRGAHEEELHLGAAELELCKSVPGVLLEMLDEIKAMQLPTARPDLEAQLRAIALQKVDREVSGERHPSGPLGDDVGGQQQSVASLPVVSEGALQDVPDTDDDQLSDTGLLEVDTLAQRERRGHQRLKDDIDAALLPAFLEEAAELAPQISEALRGWRAEPHQRDRHEALTRLLHTFKGGARMAGAMGLGELTHSMEARIVAAAELPIIPDGLFEGLEVSFDRMGVLLGRLSQPAQQPVQSDPSPARQSLRVRVDLLERLATEAGELAVSRSGVEGQVRAMRGQVREMGSSIDRLRLKVRELEIQAESQIQSRQVQADEPNAPLDPLELDRFTRLQELTRLIEENANDVTLLQQTISRHIDGCDGALAAQARMTRVLQDSLVNVRMVPFASLNERLYRVVRLTARDAGRRASLDIRGSGANLDRGIVDRIASPLEHLLRNAVAHGIESPEERRAAGKPDAGEIVLDVSQEGNEVVLVLQDDGRGLDLERLRARAVEAGRLSADVTPSPEQIAQLAFEPGVSTAQEISASSGRGVGLDVVRSEVAAVGGRIDVAFEPQRGTVFTVRLPLTMTVMQVLIMRCAGHLFALPATMVEQVRTLKPQALESVCQSGELNWQSNCYPLHDLRDLLALGDQLREPQAFTPLVLVRGGAQRAAIRIDELVAHEEVVIKELGSQLANVTGVVGAAVRGGGEIVLMLNPIRLTQHLPQSVPLRRTEVEAAEQTAAIATVLIVDDSLTVRKITGRVLARKGYRVLEARDGIEALECLEDKLPELVLLDAEMPRMDGFEVLRRMRADPLWQALPVMMITSRTAEKHRKHAMELGASAFLGKPFEEQQLLNQVAELIEKAPV